MRNEPINRAVITQTNSRASESKLDRPRVTSNESISVVVGMARPSITILASIHRSAKAIHKAASNIGEKTMKPTAIFSNVPPPVAVRGMMMYNVLSELSNTANAVVHDMSDHNEN